MMLSLLVAQTFIQSTNADDKICSDSDLQKGIDQIKCELACKMVQKNLLSGIQIPTLPAPARRALVSLDDVQIWTKGPPVLPQLPQDTTAACAKKTEIFTCVDKCSTKCEGYYPCAVSTEAHDNFVKQRNDMKKEHKENCPDDENKDKYLLCHAAPLAPFVLLTALLAL